MDIIREENLTKAIDDSKTKVAFNFERDTHNGITWTIRTSAADNSWTSICCGNRIFMAVSSETTSNRAMTAKMSVVEEAY